MTRSTGSFTVHGKKASVITFGGDWHTIPAEDRLKRHRSAASSCMNPATVAGLMGDRVIDASSLGKVIVSESSTRDNSDDEYTESGSASASASISRRSQQSRGSSAVSGRLAVVNPDAEEEAEAEKKRLNDGEISIMTASAVTDDYDDDTGFIPDAISSPTFSDATVTHFGDRRRSMSTNSREVEAVVVEIAKENDERQIEEVVVLIDTQKEYGRSDSPTLNDVVMARPEPSVSVGTSLNTHS